MSNPFNGCRNNECRPVGANWQSDSQDVQWWCKHASGCLFQAAYLLPSSICGTLAILTPGLTSIHPIHYLSLLCAGSQGGGASPSWQFITRLTFGDKQPYILTVAPIYTNLDSILHLTHMLDHPEGTKADAQRPRSGRESNLLAHISTR